MARVFIPTLLLEVTGGVREIDAAGASVRAVIESLEARFPGLRDRLVEQGRLRANISVAVDGEITPLGLLDEVRDDSEVHFITAIKGGSQR